MTARTKPSSSHPPQGFYFSGCRIRNDGPKSLERGASEERRAPALRVQKGLTQSWSSALRAVGVRVVASACPFNAKARRRKVANFQHSVTPTLQGPQAVLPARSPTHHSRTPPSRSCGTRSPHFCVHMLMTKFVTKWRTEWCVRGGTEPALGRMRRIWDGLGRTLGRIKCAKSSMFTGLGTVGRINWGGEGV
jgi:hypothetical protein